MILKWTEKDSVGVDKFDADHRELFRLLNALIDSMNMVNGDREIHEILDSLLSYTDYHFSAEEKNFVQFDYPDKVAHCKEHRHFVVKIQDLIDSVDESEKLKSIEAISFLQQWILHHINTTDKKYSDFFKGKDLIL